MREEHRIITALFADLAGSTELGERLHEEEVGRFDCGSAAQAAVGQGLVK